jgi:hypothetical protein
VSGACSTHGRGEKIVQAFGGKSEGKRPFVRPRRKWKDDIRMDLREMGWGMWSGFSWLRIGTGSGLL